VRAFAVERTQELIIDLVRPMEDGAILRSPIYVDSPLAIRATDVFLRNHAALDDGPSFARALRSKQIHFAVTADQSRATEAVGTLDWHNERARLLLDLDARLDAAGHDVARSAVLHRLRRTLEAG
jgi:Cft2 family RNA processing exonuclease